MLCICFQELIFTKYPFFECPRIELYLLTFLNFKAFNDIPNNLIG